MHSRRQVSRLALLAPLSFLLAPLRVQAQPVEGIHYEVRSARQPTRDRGRIEVVELFAYSSHHCRDLEPALEAWQKKLPADVSFRRIPVAFREDMVIHNELYLALEAMNLVDRIHAKVFQAIHDSRSRLGSPAEIATFLQSQGLDPAPVLDVMRSFVVVTRLKQARALADAYAIEGTPTLGIDGRWITDGRMAGSNAASLAVAEYLVGRARLSR